MGSMSEFDAWLERIRVAVAYDVERNAALANEAIKGQAEHIRRSLGQKARWQAARLEK